jgi:predicted short-subunit dehydrogenase-like oxidoreductase (DUF2520 family)
MKNLTFNISFIGAGNVAWHLAPAFENAGHVVKEVYSRTGESARKLVGNLYDAEYVDSLNFSASEAQLFIICIPDDFIEEVASQIILPEQSILVHTSGAKSIQILPEFSASAIGVFYPLQTFSKNRKIDFEALPILLESNNKDALALLEQLSNSISNNVQVVDSDRRAQLHIAAVFACNFSNFMMSIAEDLLNNAKLDFDLIRPLIAETIEKSLLLKPSLAQTGPAKRGDLATLDKHMQMLAKHPAYSEIYKLVSQHILNTYQ